MPSRTVGNVISSANEQILEYSPANKASTTVQLFRSFANLLHALVEMLFRADSARTRMTCHFDRSLIGQTISWQHVAARAMRVSTNLQENTSIRSTFLI